MPDVSCGNNNKILVCHIPPGNPDNSQTICMSENALPVLLAHGFCIGTCNAFARKKASNEEEQLPIDEHQLQSFFEISLNPFKESTTISFMLSEDDNMKLEVYNYFGQKIITLFNSAISANQLYSIEFNTTDLSGGVYFGIIKMRKGILINKMVILR